MFRWLRRDPKPLVERRRCMSELLAEYPVYEPPYRQGRDFPRRTRNQDEDEYFRLGREFAARGEENFAYFLAQREVRLAALGGFLRKFDVTMGLDDAGLQAVSAWCPGNYGALVARHHEDATRHAFFELAAWTGRLRGLNVIFDLGIFLGECAIARRPKLRWKIRGRQLPDCRVQETGQLA